MRRLVQLAAVAALVAAQALVMGPASAQAPTQATRTALTSSTCALSNGVQHVIYVQFDNTHLFQDRPGVPSDLEQMPNLLNFLTNNGTLSDNEHTILISHTGGGILSSLTGLYPDRNGITVSNSYRYFKPDGTTASSAAFKYWNDRVDDINADPNSNDPLPNMVTTGGVTTPAPWVAYTRAGCDYGAVSTANVVLENTGTGAFGDMTTVFGAGSPEWNEAKATPALAQTDFVGIAVHCAQGGGICARPGNVSNARADLLPDEPGGYAGYQALFGAKYVNPAITNPSANVVNDTNGQPITDPAGNPGFPGFDGMPAKVTLGYVAQMQEAGVPVTFAYISDAHDNHQLVRASGPGEADYVAALHDYDQAFGTFFSRLAADGIDKSNTLFVFTADENDHFAGGTSTDGTWSHTFCNITPGGQACPANQIGEVNQNMLRLLPTGYTPPTFLVHSDSAPTVYVNGNPVRTDGALRQLERYLASAQAIDPYVDPNNPTPVMIYMADPIEEQALHMVNADPRRTPNFTYFANPDYFLGTFDFNCPDSAHRASTCIDYHFAWSHGDATEDIGRTWLGMVGPGIENRGRTSDTWSDHADIRSTMFAVLGLHDSYEQDGAAIFPFLATSKLSAQFRANRDTVVKLRDVYKEISAPFGPFAFSTLTASTNAIKSGSATDDSHYLSVENSIAALTARRDALEAQMRTAINNATFGGGPVPSRDQALAWAAQARQLLKDAAALAASS